MEKISVLVNQLFESIAEEMKKRGFKYRGKQQDFIQQTDYGFNAFHIAIIRHENDFDITVDVGIRFDDVENLINKNNKLLTKSQKKETCTIGVEIGNLTQGQTRRWTIEKFEDIMDVTYSVVEVFDHVALDYFKKYSNLEMVYKILRRDDKEAGLHSPFPSYRAIRAVIAAIVLDKSNLEIQNLIKEKISYLAGLKKDFDLKQFRDFLYRIGRIEGGKRC